MPEIEATYCETWPGGYQISGAGGAMLVPSLAAAAAFIGEDMFTVVTSMDTFGFCIGKRDDVMLCVTPACGALAEATTGRVH